MFVTPRIIAPALRKRATKGASGEGTQPARNFVPASQRNPPPTLIELLILSGTPCSGPRLWPWVTECAAARAWRRAVSESTWTKAFNCGFSLAIFVRWASTNSTGDSLFWRICSAMEIAERKVKSGMQMASARRKGSVARLRKRTDLPNLRHPANVLYA